MSSPSLPRRILSLLAIALLAVHPLAGAGRASGVSLAEWVRALVCSCEHCGRSDEASELAAGAASRAAPDAPSEARRSCCSEREAPATAPATCRSECPCAHPAEIPLHDVPLAAPRTASGGGADEIAPWLAMSLANASFPLALPPSALEPAAPTPSPCAPLAVPRPAGALAARRVAGGAPAYLAFLATARL